MVEELDPLVYTPAALTPLPPFSSSFPLSQIFPYINACLSFHLPKMTEYTHIGIESLLGPTTCSGMLCAGVCLSPFSIEPHGGPLIIALLLHDRAGKPPTDNNGHFMSEPG